MQNCKFAEYFAGFINYYVYCITCNDEINSSFLPHTEEREMEEKWRVRVFPLPVMQPMEWCPMTRALVEMWPCMR